MHTVYMCIQWTHFTAKTNNASCVVANKRLMDNDEVGRGETEKKEEKHKNTHL